MSNDKEFDEAIEAIEDLKKDMLEQYPTAVFEPRPNCIAVIVDGIFVAKIQWHFYD